MKTTNYLYLIVVIVLLFFLSYPNGGAALFKPNRIATNPKTDTVEPKEVTLTDTSSFQALVGTESIVIGNNNGIKLNQGKQAIDVNKNDIVFYSGTDTSSERIRMVGSNGFVGIGKTNPTSMLDVAGSISTDDFVVRRNYSIMGNYGIGTTNPQVPLHVVGTTSTTDLIVTQKVGIGVTNPTYPLQVAGTVQASAMSVGLTTAPTTSLDIYESFNYVGKPFRVGGTQDTYYPVFIDTYPSTYTGGKYEFGIHRGNVHTDAEWTGAMNFYVEGKCYNCGNTGNYIKWRLTQGPQGRLTRFVSSIAEIPCGADIVVWLLGGCTYYFTGYGCKLYNGNSNGTALADRNGVQMVTKTAVEDQFKSNTCSGDSLTNTYTREGCTGVGTSVPVHSLDVYNGTGSICVRHTNTDVRVSTYANSGPYGAIEAHYNSNAAAKLPLALNAWGGNVGIGVTNPLQGKLQVAGRGMFGYIPSTKSGIFIDNEDTYGYYPVIQGVTNTLGASHIVINPAGGSVGIGTNYAATNWAGAEIPNSKLVVYGGSWGAANGTARISIGGDARHFSAIEGTHVGDGSTTLSFWTCNGVNNNNQPYRRMTINQDGNVGINKIYPEFTLDVSGTIRATGAIYTPDWFYLQGNYGLYWTAYGRGMTTPEGMANTFGTVSVYGSGRNGYSGYGLADRYCFMKQDNGPTGGIHDNTYSWLVRWDGGSDRAVYVGNSVRCSTGGDRIIIYANSYDTGSGYFYYNYGNAYGTISDQRVKTNFQPIHTNQSVEFIKRVEPTSFCLKGDSKCEKTEEELPLENRVCCDLQDGWVAQNILEACNQTGVSKSILNNWQKYEQELGLPDEERKTLLGVSDRPILSHTVNVVKHLLDKVDRLESENNQLRTTVSSLLQWARMNGFSG